MTRLFFAQHSNCSFVSDFQQSNGTSEIHTQKSLTRLSCFVSKNPCQKWVQNIYIFLCHWKSLFNNEQILGSLFLLIIFFNVILRRKNERHFCYMLVDFNLHLFHDELRTLFQSIYQGDAVCIGASIEDEKYYLNIWNSIPLATNLPQIYYTQNNTSKKTLFFLFCWAMDFHLNGILWALNREAKNEFSIQNVQKKKELWIP